MGSKHSANENALYQRIDEVLHYIWDSIGVSGSPCARDEYYAYLPQVFNMILNTENPVLIVDYLISVEEHAMGLRPKKKRY